MHAHATNQIEAACMQLHLTEPAPQPTGLSSRTSTGVITKTEVSNVYSGEVHRWPPLLAGLATPAISPACYQQRSSTEALSMGL